MPGFTTERTQGIIDSAGGGQQSQDVSALSDQAKRIESTRQAAMQANAAQNLKAATGGGGDIKALNDKVADAVMQHRALKDLDPVTNRSEYMLRLGEEIVGMEKKAKEVEKSKTGNTRAMDTYAQVAAILRRRLHAMQSEDTGAQPQPGTLPLMQKMAPSTAQPKPYEYGSTPPSTTGGYNYPGGKD
jgi:hypothetical protein